MRLANCLVGGEKHICAMTRDGPLDLTRAAMSFGRDIPATLDQAVRDWSSSFDALTSLAEAIRGGAKSGDFLANHKETRFVPPITTPSKILCVFVNYRSHGQEIGAAPGEPVYFFKHPNCIVGDGADVVVPRFSAKPDHEVELGVIIGKEGKNLGTQEAYDYIAGYTVINDISFRDGMKRGVEGTVLGRNLFRGKVADTSLPMGPWIVTRDEVPNPYPLAISLRVNGEERQNGNTDDMIFKIPELLASASEDNTLLPGDVIATGTCSGVGLYTGKYLQDGDLMEAEVEKIGVLRNRVRYQKA